MKCARRCLPLALIGTNARGRGRQRQPDRHITAVFPRRGLRPHAADASQDYRTGKYCEGFNGYAEYLVGCTYFATLLKQSPVGLPTTPYGKIDPALAEVIQKTVWQIVAAHPDSGVERKAEK